MNAQASRLDFFSFSRIWTNWNYRNACRWFDKLFAQLKRTRVNVADWWACVWRRRWEKRFASRYDEFHSRVLDAFYRSTRNVFSMVHRNCVNPVRMVWTKPSICRSKNLAAGITVRIETISFSASAEALKSSIMNVTGPLIRVLGERFSTDIKVAILETLSTFMSKVSAEHCEDVNRHQSRRLDVSLGGRPTETVLTSTSTHSSQRSERPGPSSARESRHCSRIAQSNSCSHRSDLCWTSQRTEDERRSIVQVRENQHRRHDPYVLPISRETYLLALKNCLVAVGSKISDDIRKQTEQALISLQGNESDLVRQLASNCKESLWDRHVAEEKKKKKTKKNATIRFFSRLFFLNTRWCFVVDDEIKTERSPLSPSWQTSAESMNKAQRISAWSKVITSLLCGHGRSQITPFDCIYFWKRFSHPTLNQADQRLIEYASSSERERRCSLENCFWHDYLLLLLQCWLLPRLW